MIYVEHEFSEVFCKELQGFLRAMGEGDFGVECGVRCGVEGCKENLVSGGGVEGSEEKIASGGGGGSAVCGEHDVRWLRVLRDGLGHRVMGVVSRNEVGVMDGYCPLALVKSALFGRFLVSLPYVNRAGVVGVSDEVREGIARKASEVAGLVNAQYLELRHVVGQVVEDEVLGEKREEKVLMELDLPGCEEELWKRVGAKVRNQVRKGEKNELTIRWGGEELVDEFYDVFAVNMRDLGTPVYSKRLFGKMTEEFGADAEIAVVEYEGKVVASAILVHDDYGGRVRTQVPSASCLRGYNYTNANMWMYYELLKRAVVRGSDVFDFGRSSEGSGTYRFKKQWGAKRVGCVWQYHVRKGDIGGMRPSDEKMQRKIEMWKKMPIWVTKAIGPSIVKGIP